MLPPRGARFAELVGDLQAVPIGTLTVRSRSIQLPLPRKWKSKAPIWFVDSLWLNRLELCYLSSARTWIRRQPIA